MQNKRVLQEALSPQTTNSSQRPRDAAHGTLLCVGQALPAGGEVSGEEGDRQGGVQVGRGQLERGQAGRRTGRGGHRWERTGGGAQWREAQVDAYIYRRPREEQEDTVS
jgi:hypothetical protein